MRIATVRTGGVDAIRLELELNDDGPGEVVVMTQVRRETIPHVAWVEGSKEFMTATQAENLSRALLAAAMRLRARR